MSAARSRCLSVIASFLVRHVNVDYRADFSHLELSSVAAAAYMMAFHQWWWDADAAADNDDDGDDDKGDASRF